MKKNLKKNNKGFTLIELLAVIVILGVLMIIAVPMVSKYITQAKKDAFVATAKAYVSSARYAYLNGDYDCDLDSGNKQVGYIIFNNIKVDKTGNKTSFNRPIDKEKSYVKIEVENGEYTYYVAMTDNENGFVEKKEEELERKDVTATKSLTLPSDTEVKVCNPR